MGDVNQLIDAGRRILLEKPELTEGEFRTLMLERFRANDQGLHDDKRNMSGGAADPVGGVFSALALPWTLFRWLGDLFLSVSSNIGFHQGQFAIVRRKLGKPVLY